MTDAEIARGNILQRNDFKLQRTIALSQQKQDNIVTASEVLKKKEFSRLLVNR